MSFTGVKISLLIGAIYITPLKTGDGALSCGPILLGEIAQVNRGSKGSRSDAMQAIQNHVPWRGRCLKGVDLKPWKVNSMVILSLLGQWLAFLNFSRENKPFKFLFSGSIGWVSRVF